jgi:hypothetical protein
LVPLAAAGLLGMLGNLLSAKRMSLPVLGALVLRELLTELVKLCFKFGDTAVAFAAARAGSASGSHEEYLDSISGKCRTGKAGGCSIRGASTS